MIFSGSNNNTVAAAAAAAAAAPLNTVAAAAAAAVPLNTMAAAAVPLNTVAAAAAHAVPVGGVLSPWSREEDKQFERALVMVPDGVNPWQYIAAQMPGRSPLEMVHHYRMLEQDVAAIEAGMVDLPFYDDDDDDDGGAGEEEQEQEAGILGSTSMPKPRTEERRRGLPWTVDEHRLFLRGLRKYGRGDWRNISRWAVKTRTPTQVASHAQKYFLRLSSCSRETKRKSIHDTPLD